MILKRLLAAVADDDSSGRWTAQPKRWFERLLQELGFAIQETGAYQELNVHTY